VVREDPNLPGHLSSFQDRGIILPDDQAMYPSLENLAWRKGNVLLNQTTFEGLSFFHREER